MGRGIALALGLLLALPAAASPARPHASKTERCATRGTTVAENARARVYRVGAPVEAEYYGCYLRSGRTRYLAASGGGGSHYNVLHVRLVGTRAAFVWQHSLDVDRDFTAYVVELRRGRIVRSLKRVGSALDLEMARSGSFAVLNQPAEESPSYEVVAVDAAAERTLDSGPEIDPHSLAAGGGRVYWMHGGEARSADLR